MPPKTSSLDIRIKPLETSHRELAIGLLARAFYDDPLMRYIMAGLTTEVAYQEALLELMDYSLSIREVFDWPVLGLWDDGTLSAIAALSLKEETPPSEILTLRRKALLERLGESGATRLERYGEIAEGQRPNAPHIYLGVLGVDPTAQRRGFGKLMLEEVQAFSDASPESLGVYLDTENPENVAFYEHCGYVVQSEHQLDDVHIWCLCRMREVA